MTIKRFSLIAVFLFALTLCANTFGATPTIKKYKTDNRCYITITEALTADQVTMLKAEIAKGADGTGTIPYTSVDLGTKNGYALTQNDLKLLFGEDNGSDRIAVSVLRTTNEQPPITALSLKDVTLASECITGGTYDYGWYISLLPGLLELTTPKSCNGPYMVQAINRTITSLIVPKLGANDPASAAQATVGVWKGYTTLTSIDLNTSISPSGVVADAFYGCINLSNVKIKSTNITEFGDNAFRDCTSLLKITMPSNLETIGVSCFQNSGLKTINFPNTLKTIKSYAFSFENNPNIRTLRIPASVENIGYMAFSGIHELDHVYLFGKNTKAVQDAFNKDITASFDYSGGNDKNTFSHDHWSHVASSNTVKTDKDPITYNVKSVTYDDSGEKTTDHIVSFTYDDSESVEQTYTLSEHQISATTWTDDGNGNITSVTITEYATTTVNTYYHPAQLHIPNDAIAIARYLNPVLHFLSSDEDLEALWTASRTATENEGVTTYSFNSDGFDSKMDDFETKYPQVKSYLYNGMKDYLQRLITLGETSIFSTTTDADALSYRPWVTETITSGGETKTYRFPAAVAGQQFETPHYYLGENSTEAYNTTVGNNVDYAGWNQFILAAADVEESEVTIEFDKWLDDKWYSICIPYSITRSQVEDCFGTQTEVCKFQKVVKDTNGNVTFYFEEKVSAEGGSECISAHHPYMIHPSVTAANALSMNAAKRIFHGESFTKNTDTDPSYVQNQTFVYYVDSLNTEWATNTIPYQSGETLFKFRGNPSYTDKGALPAGSYFWAYRNSVANDPGSFYHTTVVKSGAWSVYAAIVEYTGTGDNPAASAASMTLFDPEEIWNDETTRIVVVPAQEESNQVKESRVYSINGQYIGNKLEGLSKGIYILNGKKYVVK